jgi:uncharacterized membrane protein
MLRDVQKWLLLMVGFLLVGLGEELLTNLLQDKLSEPWSKALAIMLVVGVAYTLASEMLDPMIGRSVKRAHGALKPGRGALAGIVGALLLLGLVYLGYYFTYR